MVLLFDRMFDWNSLLYNFVLYDGFRIIFIINNVSTKFLFLKEKVYIVFFFVRNNAVNLIQFIILSIYGHFHFNDYFGNQQVISTILVSIGRNILVLRFIKYLFIFFNLKVSILCSLLFTYQLNGSIHQSSLIFF